METLFNVLGYRFDSGCFGSEPEEQDKDSLLLDFKKSMAESVWNTSMLESNPITIQEVVTLMGGATVAGHKVSDVDEVLGIIESHRHLVGLLESASFRLTSQVSSELHYQLGHRTVLDAGKFRGTGVANGTVSVSLGVEGFYSPPEPTVKPGTNIAARYEDVLQEIKDYSPSHWKRALMYNMAGCFQQFYFDGNKRTSRLMMNGLLLSSGYNAISIPADRLSEYTEVMVEAYATCNASRAISFVAGCYSA